MLIRQVSDEEIHSSLICWSNTRSREWKSGAWQAYNMRGLISNAWERALWELVSLLAASAPQLRHLEYRYPGTATDPALALPAELGRLSQLSSLTLFLGGAVVTTARVRVV